LLNTITVGSPAPVGENHVVCNGDLDPHDVKVAKAAREGQEALARTLVSSWRATETGIDLLLARAKLGTPHAREFLALSLETRI
jgi:hypothetical protein